jgi:hypothetical protein
MNTIKIFVFSFIFVCYIANLYSQKEGIIEKESINNMELYKAYIQSAKMGRILSSIDPQYMDGAECLYFDSEGYLKKYISWFDYPESHSTTIAYYNESGELMYIIFSNDQPEGYSYQGIAYKMVTGEYFGEYFDINNDSIEFKYKVRFDDMANFENSTVQGSSNNYPSIICDWNLLAQYTSVDDLETFLKIDKLKPPPNCKKVQFVKPSKGQETFTNSLDINVRDLANTSSKVITKIDCGDKVKILEILPEENIVNIGNHHWYKIAYYNKVGYIFGAFLEPVEIEIKS